MMYQVIPLVAGDSQNPQSSGPFQDGAPEGLKPDSEESLLHLLKIMSRDIRGSLLSMLATLKLLNRGYYGNMDEEVANQTKDLLSSATQLIGRVDACLGRAFVVKEEVEIAAPKKAGIE
ncbi:MAG TPA: hypothetical protein VLZ10_09145 [Thermodesulfobacteriota bacterium]|nr:hypothetical protein [Thermodesulfobacteriota bacterium]